MSTELPGRSAAPTAGFEAPLEMLAAFHLRIEQQCATLQRLASHLQTHGADADARRIALDVLHFFDTALPEHHADEDVDLFPALLESMAGSDAVCLREMTAGLTSEHRELENRWRVLRSELQPLAAGAPAPPAPPDVHAFTDLCARHIAHERDELLPMAERLLTDAELARIGASMRGRRTAVPPAPAASFPASA